MPKLPLWLILVTCVSGAQHQASTHSFSFLSDPLEDVRRVEQGPSAIQRVKVTLDNERSLPAPLLPLSIDSYTKQNSGYDEESSRESLSKRQASTVKPKTNEAARKPTPAESKKPGTNPEETRKAGTTPQPVAKRRDPVTEKPKSNVKYEPKTNQFGIGSTLVLTLKTEDDEPSYVDQTQPHKLAKPLRYETQGTRVENKKPEVLPKQSTRPLVKEDKYPIYTGQYDEHKEVIPLNDGYADPKPATKIVVQDYNQYQEKNVGYADSEGSSQSAEYNPYSDGRDKQVYQAYDKKVPVREVVSTPVRQPVYTPQYQPAQPEEPRKIYQPQFTEPHMPVERPKEVLAPRPVYQESRPDYVELRPTYSTPPPHPHSQNNRRPPTSEENYSGFPESYQPTKDAALSTPLQYEPPRVFPHSPCNMVFKYEGREPGEDNWFGDIYISTDEVLVGMRLDITLDRPARFIANWMSEVKTKDNMHFTILSLSKKLVPGPAETVRIQVRFNPDKPVPFLQTINLNGRRICPQNKAPATYQKPTSRPVLENPGDIPTKPTTEYFVRPPPTYEERPPATTQRVIRQPERRPATESYQPTRRTSTQTYNGRPGAVPTYVDSGASEVNRVPSEKPPKKTNTDFSKNQVIECGKPAVQPRPLVTYGQNTARGQWPWHAAIYKNVGVDLSYICGGSLISPKHVVTAAHCVTHNYDNKPFDGTSIVVYLGKYHLKMWSEGGVQNKQVSSVEVHPDYNSTDFRADLAVLVLSSPVEFTDFIRPVCLWNSQRTDISEVEGVEGTVLGWGYDEEKKLTEQLMQARMPVIKHDECLWSYPEFFPHFTSNLTYCAGFRNGTSVCNGDSGGGMVFPMKTNKDEQWFLRGIVSISVGKQDKVCDTKHYVVFTDLAKFLDFLHQYV